MTPEEWVDTLDVGSSELSSFSARVAFRTKIADAIRDAVAEEREAIAKLFESIPAANGSEVQWGDPEAFAAMIRKRGEVK